MSTSMSSASDLVLKKYDSLVDKGVILDHARQRSILEDISHRTASWWPVSTPFFYIWGSVGSGKTTLINLLYESVSNHKQRWHYSDLIHYLSQDVLQTIRSPKDWCRFVKKKFRRREILFIDEWVIEDVTQVMLWKGLLPALWSRGVFVIVTSNVAPGEIYLDGLGRDHFLSTIKIISEQAFIYDLIDDIDYRQLGEVALVNPLLNVKANFFELNVAALISDKPLIKATNKPLLFHNDKLLGVNFKQAITPPMWRKDYLTWAQAYHYIYIENVEIMVGNKNLLANWIRMVDLLYDEGCFVFLSTNFSSDDLLNKPCDWPERTKSRVVSWMQHQALWASQHL